MPKPLIQNPSPQTLYMRKASGLWVPSSPAIITRRRMLAGSLAAAMVGIPTAPVLAIPTLVAHTLLTPSGQSGGTTPNVTTTGANLIVLSVTASRAINPAVNISDSKSNTPTLLVSPSPSSNQGNWLYYYLNPTVGSGHNFTFNAPNDLDNMCVAAFSGIKTSGAVDQNNKSFTTSTTIQAGSITPTGAGSLIIATLSTALVGSSVSIDSGFTITDYSPLVASNAYGCGLAYLVQGAAAAVNPTWTVSSSVTLCACIGNFLVASSTPGGPTLSITGIGP